MQGIKKNILGILICAVITIPAWILGRLMPVAGAPVMALLIGMTIAAMWKNREQAAAGINFVSKKILQWAVILLGAGLNFKVILKTGIQSFPIILCTIGISLLIAFLFYKNIHLKKNTAVLIGVGSSICGGSAIAAAASVIDADAEEAAQAISVIFFFNILAALIFPHLGRLLAFQINSGEAFGIFAGTAINDTSSVTAAASVWDSMWGLGSQTLDKAVTVKLTRTLGIIPITFFLALLRVKEIKNSEEKMVNLKNIFPVFILYFITISIISSVLSSLGMPSYVFMPIKTLSKIFITAAMAGVGLNTNIIKLIKTGGKPIFLGASCWISIIVVSLIMQRFMGIW